MSNNDFNNEKLVISSSMSRVHQINDYKIIYKLSPSIHKFTNYKSIQTYHRQQSKSSLTDKNIQRTRIIFLNNTMNDRSPLKRDLDDIADYTAWSFFNFICCSFLLGIWAIIMSHQTKEKKRQNDLETAQQASRITALLNTFATVFGSIGITIYIVRYFS